MVNPLEPVQLEPSVDLPHVFALRLGGGLALRLRERHHADELFRRVAVNRERLARWFDWAADADLNSTAAAVARGLERFQQGSAWHTDLFLEGRVVGAVTVVKVGPVAGSVRLSFWLDAAYEGQGIMTRALTALLEALFGQLEVTQVAIAADPRNVRLVRLCERLGFEPEALLRQGAVDADGAPADVAYYGMTKDEWRTRHETSAALHLARFSLRVDDEVQIAILERHDVPELLRLALKNREYLRPWLPWAEEVSSETLLSFIEGRVLPAIASGEGFEAGVYRHGELVGGAGLHDVKRKWRSAALGYWLDESTQGSGVITRAVGAIVERCFLTDACFGAPFERLEIMADVRNLASRAVAERLGFAFEGVLRSHLPSQGGPVDVAIYSQLRGEWLDPVPAGEASPFGA